MMEINGKWFYKAPETKTVDLMPAFFDSEVKDGQVLTLKMFAPPATGENDESQGDDWAVNYYTEMKKCLNFVSDMRLSRSYNNRFQILS